MRHGITEFRALQPLATQLTASRLNAILKELESLRITNVVNGSFRKLPSGTEIVVGASQRAGKGGQAQPWDLSAKKDPDNSNQYLVTVRPGTLNGILPTNWNEEFECDDTGLHYAKAVVATDGQAITGVTIEIDQDAPVAQTPVSFGVANPVEYLFGIFLEGSVYRVIANGHIAISPKLWLTTERASPPAAGDLPFRQFFTLR